MEYVSKYPQPFTLGEATGFDVSTITEGRYLGGKSRSFSLSYEPEISRLENSLTHLRSTQDQLKPIMEETDGDEPEITKAYVENQTVM